MSKIVFITLPLSGTMNPTLMLAKSLRERGHQVMFAGMADCEPLVAPYGFECLPLFTDWFPWGFIQGWIGGPTKLATWGDRVQFYLDQRRKMIDHERYVEYLIQGGYREFQRAIADLAPDLLLIDIDLHAYWALMAHHSGVASMYTSPVLPLAEDPVVPPLNSLLEPASNMVSQLKIRLTWQQYFAQRWLRNQAMRLAGIPDSIAHIKKLARVCGYPLERLDTRTLLMPQLDWPVLVMCPEEFDVLGARKPPQLHYIEAGIDLGRKEREFPWDALDERKKLIFCSLGSVAYSPHFFQQVLDAVAREPGWQLVMNIGPTLSRDDFARVPADAILANGAPQLGLLQRADAMINHGGIGSVKECIYFAVPQVVFPIGFDQPGAAMRVHHHGLGVVGHFAQASTDQVHALLSQVLGDARFKARSQAMSQIFRAKEEQRLGATVIERFLASRARPLQAGEASIRGHAEA